MGSLGPPQAPPVIDFAPFYGDDSASKKTLAKQVREACLEKGFFQIVNHGVSQDLQDAIFEQSKTLFSLPLEEKMKYSQQESPSKVGYEMMRAQNFEKTTAGDLKEGFFVGRELPADHPYLKSVKLHCGFNKYPDTLPDQQKFKEVVDTYHDTMTGLAIDILKVIALGLGLDDDYFQGFCTEPNPVLRLLHYPPQAKTASEEERGIGAHTDFGGVTILLQDNVGGLQVFDAPTSTWIDVEPTPGALVINLGNLLMRWSNDVYMSNLHRVINKTGKERYSIPFFFGGNPDYVIGCLPGCEDPVSGPKYTPVKVGDWIKGRHAETFGVKGLKEKELSPLAVQAKAVVAQA